MKQVKRRDLIGLVGGAVIMWGGNPGMGQQRKVPVIGWLATLSFGNAPWLVPAFNQGLEETGYFDGQNVAIEYRWAEGRYDRLPGLAADLVERKVDVIAAAGGIPSALAAKSATSTIPIVFFVGTDPVSERLVASLARPGGNMTGISILLVELNPKRVELLSELVPQARTIALLVNPANTTADSIISVVQDAAAAKGKQLHVLKGETENEIEAAFASLRQAGVGGLIIGNDPFFLDRREQLVALAAREAVPAIFPFREFAGSGGLISYGPSLASSYRQIGIYAGKILKGAKPADLPVEQPTRFELAINLKTAKGLGLAVPPALLVQADELID